MKKLDKLVIKSFVGPLILTFVVAVFVLLMQFIWKYVDDIAGKGLSVGIILELLMDESGGIPLWRSMVPMGIIVAVLTVVAFIFADYVMPSAVLKYRTTLYDITRKKPALNIRPGEYYSEIDGFVIRVNKKDADGKTLHDITVYDHRFSSSQPDIVVAREGTMQTTPDERYMLFTLYDGCSYSETANDAGSESKPFTRIYFDTNKMTFDLSDFAFDKSDESIFQGGYQMMNTSQLDSNVARLKMQRSESIQKQIENIALRIDKNTVDSARLDIQALCDSLEYHQQRRVYNEALSRAERCLSDVKIHDQVITSQSEYINRHYIEWHRKFTLSVACIVLFFVGAPFGSIVRKGGLGVPLVASVLFFVLYYVIGMIAEKAVREGAIGTVGMWISTFVMLPIGIYLTYKAVQR